MRHLAQTPAQRKAFVFMAQALREQWSARKLAREAGIDNATAAKCLRGWVQQIHTETKKHIAQSAPDLASVARYVRDADAQMVPRIQALIDRLTWQLENSEDLDPKDVDTLAGLLGKRWKHLEAFTGLDVLKQVAVRREALKDGQPSNWDGVAEIEARPIDCLPAPAPAPAGDPDRDLLGDLW
jgi:hypothetical protein